MNIIFAEFKFGLQNFKKIMEKFPQCVGTRKKQFWKIKKKIGLH